MSRADHPDHRPLAAALAVAAALTLTACGGAGNGGPLDPRDPAEDCDEGPEADVVSVWTDCRSYAVADLDGSVALTNGTDQTVYWFADCDFVGLRFEKQEPSGEWVEIPVGPTPDCEDPQWFALSPGETLTIPLSPAFLDGPGVYRSRRDGLGRDCTFPGRPELQSLRDCSVVWSAWSKPFTVSP